MNPEATFGALTIKLENLIAVWKEAKTTESTCSSLQEAWDGWDIFQNAAGYIAEDLQALVEYGRGRRNLIEQIQDKMETIGVGL